ncbi:hypothetical protein MMC30_005504 [Trapelia coarctata]|nr:hypothetical protein [Trapelia coarctata]
MEAAQGLLPVLKIQESGGSWQSLCQALGPTQPKKKLRGMDKRLKHLYRLLNTALLFIISMQQSLLDLTSGFSTDNTNEDKLNRLKDDFHSISDELNQHFKDGHISKELILVLYTFAEEAKELAAERKVLDSLRFPSISVRARVMDQFERIADAHPGTFE